MHPRDIDHLDEYETDEWSDRIEREIDINGYDNEEENEELKELYEKLQEKKRYGY